MDKIVDHLLIFHGEGKIQDFPGNYTDYREWKELKEAELKESEKNKATSEQKKQKNTNSNSKPKLSYKEKKEIEKLECELNLLEKEKMNIESSLSNTTDSIKIIELSKRYEEVNNTIDENTMRLLELYELQN